MSSVDYTPVLLAQLTDLQMRVTKQDSLIAALKAEVEKLTGSNISLNNSTMRTSIPLRQHHNGTSGDFRVYGDSRQHRGEHMLRTEHAHRNDHRAYEKPRNSGVAAHSTSVAGGGSNAALNLSSAPRSRPRVASTTGSTKEKVPHPTMSLSDVLVKDEVVTLQVGTGKDADGNFTNTTATATFDGTDLNVTECALVASLVGMKSSKPGEILYKFIEELKTAGHIKKTFSIAPWRLCFVERDSVKKSLEELRSTVG
jgi:hypothetical protein